MSINLKKNERAALLRLKAALSENLDLLDFRIFGSKARGDSEPESDIDVMIEVEEYTSGSESLIDDLIFDTNLEYDCFISAIIFGRRELEDGPMSESPIYKTIEKEGQRI